MDPFAVAEIEGGSDALRENVCRGRVVERLIRIGHVHARLARLFEIPSLLLHFPVLQESDAVHDLGTRPGSTDLGNRIGVHLAWRVEKSPGNCAGMQFDRSPPFRSHRALFPGNRFV